MTEEYGKLLFKMAEFYSGQHLYAYARCTNLIGAKNSANFCLHDVNMSPSYKTCQSSGNTNGENPDVTYVTLSWQRAGLFPY